MKATRIFRQLYEGQWFHIPGFVIMFALRWVEVMKATRIFRQLYEGEWFHIPGFVIMFAPVG